MDETTKELIAIGVSVGTHCQPCLDYHLKKARELGVGEAEILEAVDVGHMVEKGAMTAMKKHVEQVFAKPQPKGGSCCAGNKPGCCG